MPAKITGYLITGLVLAACSDTQKLSEADPPRAALGAGATTSGAGPGNASAGQPGSDVGSTTAPVSAIQLTARENNARFLSQATFGPGRAEIDALNWQTQSQWLIAEFNKPVTSILPVLIANPDHGNGAPIDMFWENAITANDQLRQRMAFALSQIVVVSQDHSRLRFLPRTFAAYMDILSRHAFGNYRDLLQEVTYTPAMAMYLTYLNNPKADLSRGQMPDENYAREIMQLFTIGLNALNPDGTLRLDGNGRPIETYTNDDVTGLARVFTGLGYDGQPFGRGFFSVLNDNPDDTALYSPLVMTQDAHSSDDKTFLGMTIPAGTPGDIAIEMALDRLIDHPNTPPFIARQLIQRFTASAPTPGYVFVVAEAFRRGIYTLPDGTPVGSGQRGDLKATIAAILMSDFAREAQIEQASHFGKLREPVMRFTHWARAFPVNSTDTTVQWRFNNTGRGRLGQSPFEAASVFNFYRPGYLAPGTESGAAGLTAPELQITNGQNLIGYPNFMEHFIHSHETIDPRSFQPDYTAELALADNPEALTDHLDLILTYGALSRDMRNRVIEFVSEIPFSPDDAQSRRRRVDAAIFLIMTSSDYVVLR